MSQSYSLNQSSSKKLITRSVTSSNQLTTQNSSRDKLPPTYPQPTTSLKTSQQSQQHSREKSFTTKEQKPKISTHKTITQTQKDTKPQNRPRQNSKQQQLKDKNMFYSQLHIETHDIDVPLVRILKVNQQLLKKFIQQSSSIQNLMVIGRIQSISQGFRAMASHLIRSQRYHLKASKLTQTLMKILKSKLSLSMNKLFACKNKFMIKQKAVIVLNRLVISKIQSFHRHFFRNGSQKRLMSIVMNKVEEDQLVNMKINLQIFRQITFSREFILKCRGLTKYNTNNRGMFEKQLLKADFQSSLKQQLQRYEKIRQNVDNRNPNTQSNTLQLNKPVVKNKTTTSTSFNKSSTSFKKSSTSFTNQSKLYQNQIVLMAIKSLNLSLIDTKLSYEQKITQLNQHISQLQTQQRYLQLQQLLNQTESNNKAYESAINQLHSKSDEQIKKIITQFPLAKDEQLCKKKLLPVMNTQKTKYLKSFEKHQKLFINSQKPLDQYLTKLYQSRYFTLDLCHQLINNTQKNNFEIYKQVYDFITANLNTLVECYFNESKLKQLIDKVKQNTHKHEFDIMQQSSLIVVNISECFLAIHKNYHTQQQKYQNSINKRQEQVKTTLSRQKQSYKRSVQKDKTTSIKQQDNNNNNKIQRKTSHSNNLSASKQQSIRKQPLKQQSTRKQPQSTRKQPLKQQTSKTTKQPQSARKPLPLTTTQQVISYNILVDVIRASIIQYLKSNNSKYSNDQRLLVENSLIKRSLLPQSKGRTKLQENIEINSFVQQMNSQVQLLVGHLDQSLVSVNQLQAQVQSLTQMISLFYQLILSSTNKAIGTTNTNKQQQKPYTQLNVNKLAQTNKKWTQLCRTKTYSQHQISIINSLNSILMIHKQLTATQQSKPQQNFTQQLKQILKQKLEYQKLYNQADKKLLIKQEEYNIIEKQNKEYLKKGTQTQKELNKLKNQFRNYEQNLQQQQQSITRLKEQLNVYVTTAKNQAQQNNKLNRELTKTKHQLNSVNQQIQRLKSRQAQRLKQTSQKNTTTAASKRSYSVHEYSQMQNKYKLKVNQLEQSLAQLTNHKYQLSQTVIQVKTQLKDLQRTNQQGNFQQQKLNQQLQRNKITINKLTQLQNAYLNQLQTLQYQRDQLLRTVNELRGTLQSQRKDKVLVDKADYNRLKQQQVINGSLQSTVQTLQREISKLNRQINNLNSELSLKSTKLLQLQRQLSANSSKYTYRHQNQLNQLKHLHQQQISQLTNRIHTQQLNHQSIIKQLHTKYSTLTSSLNENNHITTATNHNNNSTSHYQTINKQPNSHNTTTNTYSHSFINRHTHQVTVLEYDPQKQIKSLKQFIQTLQQQNQKLHHKYNSLKKQLYSDQTSTQFTSNSFTQKENQQKQFYQHIVHDLKVQNDRLYSELLKVKSSSTSASSLDMINNTEVAQSSQSVNQFWVKEIKRKQEHIAQLQLTISELNMRIQEIKHNNQETITKLINENTHKSTRQTLKILQLQEQITKRTNYYKNVQKQLKDQLLQASSRLSSLQRQSLKYQSQIKQLKQSQQQQSLRVNLNYTELLLSTKQVKQLFTSFIEATNAILYKLDRTSQIYLNFETALQRRTSLINNHNNVNSRSQYDYQQGNQSLQEIIKIQQEQQAHKAEENIISLVQQFKTVIQNNHQTLKSIYQNLVCHPYTKTALQLHYLKELTFTVISNFQTVPQLSINYLSPQPLSYTYELARQQLAQQIDSIFTNTQHKIKPIEEVFVQVEEFIVSKISTSLDNYKKELHLKALDLDFMRQKLNLLVDTNLLNQQFIINQIPSAPQYPIHYVENQSYTTYLDKNMHTTNHQDTTNPLHNTNSLHTTNPLNPNNPFQTMDSYMHNHNYQCLIETSQKDSIQQQEQKLQPHQGISPQQQRRPFSGNWISKTSSNYQYRPLTSVIDKYDLMDEKMIDNHKEVMYRSYVNPFQDKTYKDQPFASGRFS